MSSNLANEQALRSPAASAPERLTHGAVCTAYRRLAPIYNLAFRRVFEHGRRRTVHSLSGRHGDRILEVGVGTGISLPHWPRFSNVTGIDICPEMLARAHRVRRKHQLENVDLQLMDAQAMRFPDNSYNKVAAMYVVSVTPNPALLLREIQRVCVPGGRICIVNHFENPIGWVKRVEKLLSSHAGFLGFDCALPIEVVTRRPGLRVHRVHRVNFGGYWSLIEAENVK